eukprot:354726-Chlamydomonas_euryale.AAC.2
MLHGSATYEHDTRLKLHGSARFGCADPTRKLCALSNRRLRRVRTAGCVLTGQVPICGRHRTLEIG